MTINEATHPAVLIQRIRELEAALREAEQALSVYVLPTNEYPGPPTTALKVVRAALDRKGEHECP
jgi:hypothetical protein